ncbi:MAG TPA: hypothetical protein VNZ55_10515 [Thermomicrobiales bacterium]|nr:hypothetical protein [Thermomicrobiales bacterium]
MRGRILVTTMAALLALGGCEGSDSEFRDAPPPEELDVRILEEPGPAPTRVPDTVTDTTPAY